MTFRSPGQPRPPGRPSLACLRWPRLLLPIVAGVVGFIVLIAIVAGVWTDYLWFQARSHYTSVFGTTYGTRWLLFLVTALFMVAVVGANAVAGLPAAAGVPPGAAAEPAGPGRLPDGRSTRTGGWCSGCCSA